MFPIAQYQVAMNKMFNPILPNRVTDIERGIINDIGIQK